MLGDGVMVGDGGCFWALHPATLPGWARDLVSELE